jgi:hypothetical protein
MSIYPVKLSKWFGSDTPEFEITLLILHNARCLACYKKVRFNAAIGHHSLPWGYGDIWCSWKCCKSRKVAKPDKRQERKIKRLYG